MQSKRGQELSTNTIIFIILGILVLVILFLSISSVRERVFPFFFSTNNVETIKTNCATACATTDQYSYCTAIRTLKAEDLPEKIKEKKETCKFFSTDTSYTKYGIETCDLITCP